MEQNVVFLPNEFTNWIII